MGNCWSSPAESQTSPSATGNISSEISNTTSISQSTPITSSSSVSGKSQFSASSSDESSYTNGPTPNLREFTYQELKTATRNFNIDTLLGVGGFGSVYKGWLGNKHPSKSGSGLVVAIKKLNFVCIQGFEEWQSEIDFLGRLSHRNLIKLLGYCWEGMERLLVYEFMQNGSLGSHLFERESASQPLRWELRLNIIIGAARGLAFLHSSDDNVIHRDIKASDILLDDSYNAKISDLGLAKLGPSPDHTHLLTRVMGTYGYAAPEYVRTGFLSVKSDVYSFGVVLVELLTGLRAFDANRPNGKQKLMRWIRPHIFADRRLRSVMDTRLEGKYPLKSATETAKLALKCLAPEPRARPDMREVLAALEKIQVQEVLATLEKIQGKDHNKPKVVRRHSSGGSPIRPHGHPRQKVPT